MHRSQLVFKGHKNDIDLPIFFRSQLVFKGHKNDIDVPIFFVIDITCFKISLKIEYGKILQVMLI